MGRKIVLLAFAAAFVVFGCSGGTVGTLPPPTSDMSGIQGQWDFHYTIDYSFLAGDQPVAHQQQVGGVYAIAPNSVTYNNGVPLDWSYDGDILLLRDVIDVFFIDDTCGGKSGTGILNLRIPVTTGDGVAVISGDVSGSVISDWCGPMILTGTAAGSMIIR